MSQDASTFCELDKVMEVARRMSHDPHLVWFEARRKDCGIQPSLKHCVSRIILILWKACSLVYPKRDTLKG